MFRYGVSAGQNPTTALRSCERNNEVPPMLTLKLTAVGNSVGVVLPKEALDRLHLVKCAQVFLTESPDGFRLTPYSPEFATQMSEARRIMKKRREVLRELAK
jgi:putative addiction module antidote